MARSDRIAKGVTRVTERRNITTGKQMNLRLTGLDDDALSMLVEKVQEKLPQKTLLVREFSGQLVILKTISSLKSLLSYLLKTLNFSSAMYIQMNIHCASSI